RKKLIATIAFCVVCLFLYSFVPQSFGTPTIFQTPYKTSVKSEFEALFHKHGIDVSENDFWATSLNGRTPQDILNEKAKLLYIKFNLLEKEARKYGFNKEKLDFKKVDWKLVSDRYIELKQIVIDEKIKTVNHDQIKQYYLENNLNFARQDLINGKISTWNDGLIISTESVEINEETVRLVTERFPDLELQLENIEVGQQFSWKQNGIYYTFSCLSREDKGIIPLSEITDAVAMQCAEELVDNWLNKETDSLK
ncbi:TPA: hypothetical protein TY353_002132, partial [Streptococcus suis]|nr:hypothetical protein [Streptococcus suis]